MFSSKFILIRKDRSLEQRFATIWEDACMELKIPCILIYESNRNACITLDLQFIPERQTELADQELLLEKLSAIQKKYTGTSSGIIQENASFFTFNALPVTAAREAATAIFDLFISIPEQESFLNLPADVLELEV